MKITIPINDRVPLNRVIDSQWGSLATPITVLTGVTSGTYNNRDIVIPSGNMVVGDTLHIEALVRRMGTASSNILGIILGTTNTSGDALAYNGTIPAITNYTSRISLEVGFSTETSGITTYWQAPGTTQVGAVQDMTANLNLNLDMYISFLLLSGNAADSFHLLGYRISLMKLGGY